jgi:hypothetical protein
MTPDRVTKQATSDASRNLAGPLGVGVALDLNNLLQEIMTYAAMAKRRLPSEHPALTPLVDIESAGTRAGSLVRALIAERIRLCDDLDE